MSEDRDEDANVPDYVVGGGKKKVRVVVVEKKRVRVIRPRTKSTKPAKRK